MVINLSPHLVGGWFFEILLALSLGVGLVINQASLSGIYKSFLTIFNEQLTVTQPTWPRIAMEVPSTGSEIDYKWLLSIPMLREWIGERYIKNMEAMSWIIKNKTFEGTVGVLRELIEDDQVGVYRPIIQGLADNTMLHPDLLSFTLLKGGFDTLCFDGQFFFDTDHPVAGASVSNHGGGASTPWYLLCTKKPFKPLIKQNRRPPAFLAKDKLDDDNVFMKNEFLYGVDYRGNAGYGLWQLAFGSKQTLNAANYAAARAAMLSFKNEEGIPLNVVPDLLVVPPTLEGAGNALLKAQKDAAGADNIWVGTAELMVSPWLA